MYKFNSKPFKHTAENVDTNDDDLFFSKNVGKKQKKSAPISKANKKLKFDLEEVYESDDDNKYDQGNRIRDAAAVLLQNSNQLNISQAIELDLEEDEATQQAKKLLQRIKSTSKPAVHSSEVDLNPTVPFNSSFVIPKIHKAEKCIAPSVGSNVTAAQENNLGQQIKFRTRLNGVHEHKWKLCATETFSKVRARFIEVYGLPVESVKFVFDGEAVEWDATPESLEMEDDDIVEVKVQNKALVENAIKRVSSH